MQLNRWAYSATVMLVAAICSASAEFHTFGSLVLGLLLLVLTFPLGVIGSLCALTLIYFGIATPAEAYVIAAPLFALAGMLQWYVLLPRFYRCRNGSPESIDPLPHSSI